MYSYKRQTRRSVQGAVLRLALAFVGASLALWGVAGVARGATGDQLRQITVQGPPCYPGDGVAFDGTHLILSCQLSNQSTKLLRVSPADGSIVDTLTISGIGLIGTMTSDGSHGLWVCYGGTEVYLVDTSALTATKEFSPGDCVDGLAYDRADGTIWASRDAYATISHYKPDGTILGTFYLDPKLGHHYQTGIAVGGNMLYLVNDDGAQLYQCTKDLVTCTLMFSPGRILDLAYDNVTFAPKCAIWAYTDSLHAWEIPCTVAGGQVGPPSVGVRTATPTSTPAPKAAPTSPPTATPTAANTVLAAQVRPSGGASVGVRPAAISAPNTGTGGGAAGAGTPVPAWLALLTIAGIALLSAGAATALRARR